MASFIASNQTIPRGSYVVAGPARTDAIGGILRTSFSPQIDAGDDLKRLLAQLDRATRQG